MAGLLMDGEELSQLLQSFILCGNGISKRSLNLLSSNVQSLVENSPDTLVATLKKILCEFDSPVVSTRILVSLCSDLQDMRGSYFRAIVESALSMLTNEQTSSIISAVHNTVYFLPVQALSPEEASEIGKRIVALLPVFRQNDSLQIIATSLSMFMKKWATIITNPEIPVMSVLSMLSEEGLTYSVLSLLCQSAVYLFLALLGDSINLRDMVVDLFERRPTILDRCTSVSQIRFMDYAVQSLPRAVLLQMVGCFLSSLNEKMLNEVADRFPLLQPCIQRPPRDALGLTCYYTMLSAVLRATAKQLTPKALNMCAMALLACPHPRDNASRKATRSCLSTILQCSSHISNQQKFNEMLFNKIMKLSVKSVFRHDCLPLMIPAVGFHCITLEFFEYLVSLFDSHSGQAMRCMFEVYKTFDVPKEYTAVLVGKLDQMNSATRLAILTNIGKARPNTISLIQEHVQNMQGLEENRRLALQLSLATIEAKTTRRTNVSLGLLREAVHSWDFEIRLSALRLLCVRPQLDQETMTILYESVPRVFVYSDIDHQKMLESALETITAKFQGEKIEQFLTELFGHLIPLLRPKQSGVKKAYLVNCLKIAWRRKPLFLLSHDLMDELVMGLFESSYLLRDAMFRTLLLIIKSVKDKYERDLVSSVLSDKNHFVTDLIDKYKDSERFREADGAARLMALLNIVKEEISCDSIVEHIYSQFLQYAEKKDAIPSHFPLSVILHYLQSSTHGTIDSSLMTNKLIPFLLNLIRDSLAFIGVEANVESIPVHSIVTVTPPESQLQLSASKSWLAVRQALNIIAWIINRNFDSISCKLVNEIGNTLFNFLVESRHYSTVYYAHLTFQALCSRCFMREDDCAKFPLTWCDRLIEAAGTFTSGDHKCAGGFVQTAMAMIHSEPAHLFGRQRIIYHKLIKMCLILLEKPGSDNELLSALLLTEAIANDTPTHSNIEPYAPQLVMAVLSVNCHSSEKLAIIRTANRCLKLLMKFWQRKEDTREFQPIQHNEFFENVGGSLDFIHDHLTPDQPDIAYIILQLIQMMHPFRDLALMMKIANMRKSRHSRVRQAAARCLLVVLPYEQADSFVRKAIRDLRLFPYDPSMMASPEGDTLCPPSLIETDGNIEEMELPDDEIVEDKLTSSSESESEEEIDFNTCDGILLQIQQILKKYPSIRETLVSDVQGMCTRFLENNSSDYMQVYSIVQLAREFGCLHSLSPLLLRLSKMGDVLKTLPMGRRLLRASFSILGDKAIIEILRGHDDSAILHLLLQMKTMSPEVESVCIDSFLSDRNQAVVDFMADMFLRTSVHPSESQKQRFQQVLLQTDEDQRLQTMLNLAPMFTTDAKEIFRHFKQYAEFVDRSDSYVMAALSNIALCFKDELFSTFDETDYTHWKTALRIISDENPGVRAKCCQALSARFSADHSSLQPGLELCEYDLIQFVYSMIGRHSETVLEDLLQDFRDLKEELSNAEFKQEPPHFLHPPSFHKRCIKNELKAMHT